MSSSSSSSPFFALAVFTNTLTQGLIRSVHGYQDDDGEKWVEREFVFSSNSCVQIHASPVILIDRPQAKFVQGEKVGLWLCVLAFDSDNLIPSASSASIPSILCFSRNPQLKSIPTIANDLQKVYSIMSGTDKTEPLHFASKETHSEKEEESYFSTEQYSIAIEDQFSHSTESRAEEDQLNDQLVPDLGMSPKKRRAATNHVASISLSELAKYFNVPITEASRNLKVGLTVLKRKCREFGIPRWPHRKIKSLDTLIHNLQEEVSRQQKDNEVAAVKAATKRQQMLESEKQGIERSPFMELQIETKRFRQDVFKRRHKAKALSKAMSQQSVPCQDHHC